MERAWLAGDDHSSVSVLSVCVLWYSSGVFRACVGRRVLRPWGAAGRLVGWRVPSKFSFLLGEVSFPFVP